MKLLVLFFALLVLGCKSADRKPITEQEQRTSAVMTGAVIAGDYPDPSVIKVEDTYYAVATTSYWIPAFTLLKSADLVNWEIAGAVFESQPKWAAGNYWAPEITVMDKTFYVYFAAKNKEHGRMCLGVATASKVEGPYKDRGPMICQGPGSIDAMPIVDEKGEKWLAWKEDGNSQNKPTPIWLSKLNADGTKLVGKMVEILRNDSPWEKHLIEGPFIMKHNRFWYMFYAANSCCTRECAYAVGVARAEKLQGPWVKNPDNPIIDSNETWKCPGHGSVVTDPTGGQAFMYHAIHTKDSVYVGRQALVDTIQWQENGWPRVNNGMGPGTHAGGLLGKTLLNKEHVFRDEFDGEKISPVWQWPHNKIPKAKVREGKLTLVSNAVANEPLGAFVGKSTTTGDYTVTVVANAGTFSSGAMGGIAAVGNAENAVGISIAGGKILQWTKTNGAHKEIGRWDAPTSKVVYLKMNASNGRNYRFEVSADGISWNHVGMELDGYHLPPWDLGVRISLTAGGPTGSTVEFESIKINPL